MTDRMKLLEAVAEAARITVYPGAPLGSLTRLYEAVQALDALPAQPQREMMTLAVWRNPVGAFC